MAVVNSITVFKSIIITVQLSRIIIIIDIHVIVIANGTIITSVLYRYLHDQNYFYHQCHYHYYSFINLFVSVIICIIIIVIISIIVISSLWLLSLLPYDKHLNISFWKS